MKILWGRASEQKEHSPTYRQKTKSVMKVTILQSYVNLKKEGTGSTRKHTSLLSEENDSYTRPVDTMGAGGLCPPNNSQRLYIEVHYTVLSNHFFR